VAGVILIPLWRFGPDLTVDEDAMNWRVPYIYRPSRGGIEKSRDPDPPWGGPWG
jgi:hypothetical protein